MPAAQHLLIPDAALPLGADGEPAPLAPGPNLSRLLRLLQPTERIALDAFSPALPYEVAVARANGLPDTPGHTPWAAFETRTLGQPCAWIQACHWQIGMDHLLMGDPTDLALSADESQSLLNAMAPLWAEDGITLQASALPGTWLARGEPLRGLPSVSLQRLIGRDVSYWVSGPGPSAQAARLRRLLSEMQMLFYTLPANEAREQRGQLPVNAFWITGAGELDALPAPGTHQPVVENRLTLAAQRRDAAAHASAWQAVDSTSCAALLTQAQSGSPVRLTLCGERAAQTWELATPSFWQRLQRFGRKTPDLLATL
ncbi:MAG: hypothetical protein GAK30_00537 [Paracidovorax wautersii]|uniref:Phosphoglycerate mutase n=1 Tax=Paracidovorax wautersii TaxID=1177982 RepID=A0A7V8FRH7_9BURK|nr:MAG: hypothetical protein GAK30_00537 [Paracidovorax wautersii]